MTFTGAKIQSQTDPLAASFPEAHRACKLRPDGRKSPGPTTNELVVEHQTELLALPSCTARESDNNIGHGNRDLRIWRRS
jgi:hypothetical protein